MRPDRQKKKRARLLGRQTNVTIKRIKTRHFYNIPSRTLPTMTWTRTASQQQRSLFFRSFFFVSYEDIFFNLEIERSSVTSSNTLIRVTTVIYVIKNALYIVWWRAPRVSATPSPYLTFFVTPSVLIALAVAAVALAKIALGAGGARAPIKVRERGQKQNAAESRRYLRR